MTLDTYSLLKPEIVKGLSFNDISP